MLAPGRATKSPATITTAAMLGSCMNRPGQPAAAPAAGNGGDAVRNANMDILAARLAAFLAENAPDARRGAVDFPTLGLVAAFGQDGFIRDARVRREVKLIQADLPAIDLNHRGFGVAEGGSSWAILVDAEPGNEQQFRALFALVWLSWARSSTRRRRRDPRVDWVRYRAADAAIRRAQDDPTWWSGLADPTLLALAAATRSTPGAGRRPALPPREQTEGSDGPRILPFRDRERIGPDKRPEGRPRREAE